MVVVIVAGFVEALDIWWETQEERAMMTEGKSQ